MTKNKIATKALSLLLMLILLFYILPLSVFVE